MVWVVGMMRLLCLPLAGRRSSAVLPLSSPSPALRDSRSTLRIVWRDFSPARHPLPPFGMANAPLRGGTLADAPSVGHFLSPLRSSLGASSSVLLTRDARSGCGAGFVTKAPENCAACMGKRRGLAPWSRRSPSFRFREAAHQLRAHHANRHHASGERWGQGAAGRVLRNTLPRPSIASEINYLTHANNSLGSSSRKREANKERFACVEKLVAS